MAILINVVGVLIAWCFLSYVSVWFADTTTTMSLSPDETHRIVLVERKPNLPLRLDRNFKIILVTLSESGHQEIRRELLLDSPDEGRPVGTERFVWSKDSSYVLLVGKHFFVERDMAISSGEQAYFLYHLPSKRNWYNTKQMSESSLELTQDVLQAIEFEQPLGFKKP